MLCRALILLCAIIGLTAPAIAARPANVPVHFLGDGLVRVRLIPESHTVARGGSTWLALELIPARGWHLYWRNPGDSGLPPKISWVLPHGVRIGATAWPAPQRLTTGDITTYIYEGRTTLLVPLTIAGSAHPARDVAVRADLSWLVCSHVCVPGSAHTSAHFAIASTTPARQDRRDDVLFAAARARLPRPAHFKATFTSDREQLRIAVPRAAFPDYQVTDAFFFPFDGQLIAHSAPQRVAIDDRVTLTLQRSGLRRSVPFRIDGVLTIDGIGADGRHERSEYAVSAKSAIVTTADPPLSLVAAFVLAFLGGLVLNVMPCVFPVLSFKALGVIHETAPNRRWPRAMAYAAGVIVSCSALGLVLLVLRSGGNAFGWGFQWQSPLFVALLALLLLSLALSMSGVAELVIPLPGQIARRTGGHGAVEAFADGALVALIASSCTAPYMGAALGFALTTSAPVGLGIFASLGIGLALPYVLVTGFPAVAARLPKPGPWMVIARRLLAIPLYVSVAWLVWVFSQEVDGSALFALLAALGCVGFGVAAFGISAQAGPRWRRASVFFGIAGFAAAIALVAPANAAHHNARTQPASRGALRFEPFTPARLADLRRMHRPVFVDLTAAWCITCQINERLALERPEVAQRFAELHVTLLRGDWTNQDAQITTYLEQFGRSGVPLYVYYRGDDKVEVWPQILTPGLALSRLTGSAGLLPAGGRERTPLAAEASFTR